MPGTNRLGIGTNVKEWARADARSSRRNRERPISTPRQGMLRDREQGPIGRGARLSDGNGPGMGPVSRAKGGDALIDVFV